MVRVAVDPDGMHVPARNAKPARISRTLWLLALLFATAGIGHFVRTDGFLRITPEWVPNPRLAVYLSGAAEIAGAIGLLWPATRRAAGWGLILLLVAVFPANVHMLQLARDGNAAAWYIGALWVRLPLQPLLIWLVWRRAARGDAGRA